CMHFVYCVFFFFFFSSRRRHTRSTRDWSSDVCSSDLTRPLVAGALFSVPLSLWHFPQFYEAALQHHPLHIVQHLVFLATAVIMRSEERRVGKECRSRWLRCNSKEQ